MLAKGFFSRKHKYNLFIISLRTCPLQFTAEQAKQSVIGFDCI